MRLFSASRVSLTKSLLLKSIFLVSFSTCKAPNASAAPLLSRGVFVSPLAVPVITGFAPKLATSNTFKRPYWNPARIRCPSVSTSSSASGTVYP